MPNSLEKWLNCQVSKGMFSDELAVSYPSLGECRKSVFVPKKYVKKTGGVQGKVRVKLVKQEGLFMAVLPSSRQDLVLVSESDVSE